LPALKRRRKHEIHETTVNAETAEHAETNAIAIF